MAENASSELADALESLGDHGDTCNNVSQALKSLLDDRVAGAGGKRVLIAQSNDTKLGLVVLEDHESNDTSHGNRNNNDEECADDTKSTTMLLAELALLTRARNCISLVELLATLTSGQGDSSVAGRLVVLNEVGVLLALEGVIRGLAPLTSLQVPSRSRT